MKKIVIVCFASVMFSGCATVSYSPPNVNVNRERNLSGAIELVDDFIVAYRARADEAGNGRQFFDVPAIAAAIGAVAATAFGAGTDVTIAAGAVGALTAAGKTYWAPNAKAQIYSDGVNALLCIQQVSLDLKPFKSTKFENMRSSFRVDDRLDDVRLYTVIRNAILTVEENVRSRLRNTGSMPDVAALTEELQEIIKKQNEAKEEAEEEVAKMGKVPTREQRALEKILELVPKLEECAIRAKA